MLTRREAYQSLLLSVFPLSMFGQRLSSGTTTNAKPKRQKFYITGLGRECDEPLISYGEEMGELQLPARIDALLRCCEEHSITVWTEKQWLEAGGDADVDRCKAERGGNKAQ